MSERTSRRRPPVVLALLLGCLLLAACSSAPAKSDATKPDATKPDGTAATSEGAVVVASFDFAESRLLAEIYAQALERTGVPVRRSFDLGPRELVLPALQQGLVDVVPEYIGSALQAMRPGVPVPSGTAAAAAALSAALRPWQLTVLHPAAASDANGFVVPAATARELDLSSVSDLRRVVPRLRLGGPPECPRRPYCLLGLQSRYGLHFAGFSAFASEAERRTALADGVVDVAVMFTTDGLLVGDQLVLLIDDRGLQPPENVVPIVSRRVLDRYGSRVSAALDAVSAQLSTSGLRFVNWRIDVAGKPVPTEADAWLRRHVPSLAG